MTNLVDFRVTDLITPVFAAQYNRVIDSVLRGELTNSETLSGNKTLSSDDYALQIYAPTAARDVTLPATAAGNHPFYIVNASTTYVLTVKDAVGTIIDLVLPGAFGFFASDGATLWRSLKSPSAIADGWMPVMGTWAYASATTITVPSGAASLYSVGDKIKWTQTTVKYAYIVAVADTLLTVVGDAVTNATITLPYYSKVSSPLGFPQWFAWVPSLTTGTATLPSYAFARFSIVGRTCHIVFNVDNVTIGGAAGTIKVTLPVAAAAGIVSSFWGNIARYIAADGYVSVRGLLASTYVEVFKNISTTNYAGNETGFYLRIMGSYEF